MQLCPSSTLAYKTHTHNRNTRSHYSQKTPSVLFSIEASKCRLCLKGENKGNMLPMMPLHPFTALVKSSKTAVTHQSEGASQYCLQARLINQRSRTCKLNLKWDLLWPGQESAIVLQLRSPILYICVTKLQLRAADKLSFSRLTYLPVSR